MKNYIKPTFTLASLFPVALAVGSNCANELEDLSFIYPGVDMTKAFADGEGCEIPLPTDDYCKFSLFNENPEATKIAAS